MTRADTTLRLLLPAALLLACGFAGFHELFSSFVDYDDEGWLMMLNLLFLNGYTPYQEIPSTYGPFWLAIVKLLHGALTIPVGHDAVRFVTLAWWLLLAAVAAALVQRLTRSLAWGCTALVLTFLFVRSIVNEPGHPQAFVAIAALLVPLIGCGVRAARQRWAMIGLAAAAVFNVKYNAGAFCLAAVAVALSGSLPWVRLSRAACLALAAASLPAPFLLMYPLLADANCRAFAGLAALSAAAVALAVPASRVRSVSLRDGAGAFTAGFALLTAASFVFLGMQGADPRVFVSEALAYSRNQVGFYHFFRDYSTAQLGLAAVSLMMAAGAAFSAVARPGIVRLARYALVASALYALIIDGPAHAQAMLAHAVPWSWAVAFGREDEPPFAGRLLLAALSAWMPLIAYPIPGSQLYFGTLPALLAALVCAADAARDDRVVALAGGDAARLLALLALVLAIATLGWRSEAARQRHAQFDRLALPGARLLRMEPARAAGYRELVEALAGADYVVTTFRFNSLALWRGAKDLSPADFSSWPLRLAPAAEQARVTAALQSARRPMVVRRRGAAEEASAAGAVDWIGRHFAPSREIGPYTLLERRSDAAP